MLRYVAFLRGVSPLNAKMRELKGCFERVGFTSVKTVLSSGNVVFDARASKESTLEHRAEAAMEAAKRVDARTQGGGCNGGGPWSLFLHDSAAN